MKNNVKLKNSRILNYESHDIIWIAYLTDFTKKNCNENDDCNKKGIW